MDDTIVEVKRSRSMPKKEPSNKKTSMRNSHLPSPIGKDLRHRFYTAVVFLKAVTHAYAKNRQPASQDPTWQSDNCFEVKYQNFLNRLSQFCDVKLGGDSVTAFTVLDMQDRVQYRFACNRMNNSRLERISKFVSDLLATLKNTTTPRQQLERVLTKVLTHCRTRIHSYLTALTKACRACIETRPADRRTLEQLNALRTAASEADFKRLDEDTFAQRCRPLLDLIHTYTSDANATILTERMTHSSMTQSSSCWSELRHHAGRLRSYDLGVEALLVAAETFPALFDNHEVVFVRSSAPDENPVDKNKDIKAERILRTMTQNQDMALYYNSLVQDARSLNLDDVIQEMVSDETFQPIVHAELLVLQSLEREGLVHPSNFFNAWRYIGSSKPTCRLCHYYFQRQNGGFHVRPTHGNIYINWKPPDLFKKDGETALKARHDMLNSMVIPIRAEALRTLAEKVPRGKQHDSTTGMTSRAFGVLDRGAGLADVDVDVDAVVDDDMETSFED
ncbi:hypothetical protein M406DRAFT_351125 [Cryphonectria parasitica EP155]|uniref:Uncharacterized protein n=1 Tax=Cryphonectria parasitica (strain ATCC 38755 / EP155) TaxID=660469 RepID=A0A9P4Y3Z1_CRYP1|nr:uncharacterized protein M406DRAFT_351125 [Cryphonectria parasitica EP155]KAF3765720.1 hypothetical protein M406DRAFT_351125 [Cryphonectria parasitica EP155]